MLTRREWLALTAAPALLTSRRPHRGTVAQGGDTGLAARRIARVIQEYEAQGFHRTGTPVDRTSGEWLAEQVRQIGLTPSAEPFPLNRVDPVTSAVIVADRHIEGLPLFDGAFTTAAGIRGRLGGQTGADVALIQTPVNASAVGPLGGARRASRHKAIIAVTAGRRPGLCPSNADSFLRPFGPAVIQVSSTEASWLAAQTTRGAEVQLIAHVARTPVTANNITAVLQGTDPGLSPLVVMTPRSGWYGCASERGGGITCWLEIMRALQSMRPARSIWFVASSGHELGYLGIHAYLERRPDLVRNAAGWLHLGANIGAAIEPGSLLQTNQDEFEAVLSREMSASGLEFTRRQPGSSPGGEAQAVHQGGGRYASVIGTSALFHNADDRGPGAVDPTVIAKFSAAFTAFAWGLAR